MKVECELKDLHFSYFHRVNDNAGTRTTISVLNDRVTDLYIGKSSLPLSGRRDNAKFSMMSLAIWERSLTAGEIGSIHVYG